MFNLYVSETIVEGLGIFTKKRDNININAMTIKKSNVIFLFIFDN